MTIHVSEEPVDSIEADALVVGVVQGSDGAQLGAGVDYVDDALGGALTAGLTALGATGRLEEVTRIPVTRRLRTPLVVAVGLGPVGDHAIGTGAASPVSGGSGDVATDPETLRRAAGAAIRAVLGRPPGRGVTGPAGEGAVTAGKRRLAVALPATDPQEAEAVGLGALLGGYVFRRYRLAGGNVDTEITLLRTDGRRREQVDPGRRDSEWERAARRAQVLADAVTLARDLVNTSPRDLVPAAFAAEAERVAAASGLAVQVLDEHELTAGGYGGILGVGRGSVHPPRLVRLAYTHPDATKTVVFAGKGITFDSGGLSLKPPKSMETMKSDMAGAAAVLGALQALAALRPVVNVIGYLPMAENMPGGAAQRPSDVITIRGGKTVEVLNTDAEGRLVLADVLASCAEDSPDLIVDVATLTGAQLIALGPRVAGVMGSDDTIAAAVADAARRAGEQAWPMPLPEHLRRGLDSAVADITNVASDKDAGMLVAGMFLREFVPTGVPWAHLDIAGPAFNKAEPYGYTPKGGTGAATRTLVQVAEDVANGRLLGERRFAAG